MNMMGTPGQCQMDRGLWKRRAQQDPWISTGSLPAPMNWKRPHEGKKVCWKWSKQKINITYYIIVYDLFDLYFVCTKNSINTLLEKKKKANTFPGWIYENVLTSICFFQTLGRRARPSWRWRGLCWSTRCKWLPCRWRTVPSAESNTFHRTSSSRSDTQSGQGHVLVH